MCARQQAVRVQFEALFFFPPVKLEYDDRVCVQPEITYTSEKLDCKKKF